MPGPASQVVTAGPGATASKCDYEPLCVPDWADVVGLGLGVGELEAADEEVPRAVWAASARARASRRRVWASP